MGISLASIADGLRSIIGASESSLNATFGNPATTLAPPAAPPGTLPAALTVAPFMPVPLVRLNEAPAPEVPPLAPVPTDHLETLQVVTVTDSRSGEDWQSRDEQDRAWLLSQTGGQDRIVGRPDDSGVEGNAVTTAVYGITDGNSGGTGLPDTLEVQNKSDERLVDPVGTSGLEGYEQQRADFMRRVEESRQRYDQFLQDRQQHFADQIDAAAVIAATPRVPGASTWLPFSPSQALQDLPAPAGTSVGDRILAQMQQAAAFELARQKALYGAGAGHAGATGLEALLAPTPALSPADLLRAQVQWQQNAYRAASMF